MATTFDRSVTLQSMLNTSPDLTNPQDPFIQDALDFINQERVDPKVARICHATWAFFLEDDLTLESTIYPVQVFGEVIVRAKIPKIECVDFAGRLYVVTPLVGATVLGPEVEIEPELVEFELDEHEVLLPINTRLHRPLYAPVESLYSMYYAA